MPVTVGSLIWFWGGTLMLAILLFFPVSKMIWVSSVRRAEKKLARSTTEDERERLRRKARIITAVVVTTFAFLFNQTLFPP